MINLNNLNTNAISEYDTIIANKNNRIALQNLRPKVLIDYNTYQNNFTNIHTLLQTNYTNLEKDDLKSCYANRQPVNDIKKRIINNQPADFQFICPFCLYHKREEMDHYIPKEKYPEYSVLTSNLIPICSVCNKKKSLNWKTVANRRFIHFYFDILPNLQFLYAQLNFANNIPNITWSINNPNHSINASLYNIISDHFNSLKLCDRYKEASNDLISEIHRIVTKMKLKGQITTNDIAEELISIANVDSSIYGPNYWKSIATNLLANNHQFLNSL